MGSANRNGRERRENPVGGRVLATALLAVVVALDLIEPSRAVATSAGLPPVIPQPQRMSKRGEEPIALRNAAVAPFKAPAEHKAFFEEARSLIESGLPKRSEETDAAPASAIIRLAILPEFEALRRSDPLLTPLTPEENAALARGEQAYVIRMQAGAPAQVWLIGSGPVGLYYAAATLVQLIRPDASGAPELPLVDVQDFPDIAGRMCADWVLTWDWEVNGYDWGDGLDAFVARCKARIDLCARYKINRVRFLGGRIAPGPPYMRERYAAILRFARELNQYARRKGVALQYSSTSFGLDHYGWGLPCPEPWILNRKGYPEGESYVCQGRAAGGCLSNNELIELIAERQVQLVRDIEPASLYLHNVDIAMYADLAASWKDRCPQCRQQFPDDEPYSPRGYAAAVAGLYNRLTARLKSVQNPVSGYDAGRDLEIVFASPGYTYWPESDADWEKNLRYFSEIARQVTDKRHVQLTFREQFNRVDGRGLRVREMDRALGQAGWPGAIFLFAVQGADFLDSPRMLVSSPVLTGAYEGAATLYNFNGHVFSEVQVLANVNYAWNRRAQGAVEPDRFAGPALRAEVSAHAAGARHSGFLYGHFLDAACAALYGRRAAPYMAAVFRLERDKGPVVPLVAWVDRQAKNATYDWRAQADRNREAGELVTRAAAVCEPSARPELLRLSDCLEVVARICLLADAVHHEKPGKAAIDAQATDLLAWLEQNHSFQIAEPDGGDPGFWKTAVHRIRDAAFK